MSSFVFKPTQFWSKQKGENKRLKERERGTDINKK